MKEEQAQQDLASIRSLMERSSKFISLSGLSGVLAGVYALAGAFLAHTDLVNGAYIHPIGHAISYSCLFFIALAVLLASIITAFVLSARKAKRKGQAVWGSASRALLFNMAVPLATGGILILIFFFHGYYGIIAPASLIFYGLALTGAGNHTFTDVRYLGLSEIILGLIAALYPGYGLLIWAIGFGILHIVYGSIMYYKYDRWSIPFDKLEKAFENRVRLQIMSILMVNDRYNFNSFKELLGITDGNLASHLKALEKESYILVIKSFSGRKPNTSYEATAKGKQTFKAHLNALEVIINQQK